MHNKGIHRWEEHCLNETAPYLVHLGLILLSWNNGSMFFLCCIYVVVGGGNGNTNIDMCGLTFCKQMFSEYQSQAC